MADERVAQIIEYILDNGEITKEDVCSAFDISELEYADVRREVLQKDVDRVDYEDYH